MSLCDSQSGTDGIGQNRFLRGGNRLRRTQHYSFSLDRLESEERWQLVRVLLCHLIEPPITAQKKHITVFRHSFKAIERFTKKLSQN